MRTSEQEQQHQYLAEQLWSARSIASCIWEGASPHKLIVHPLLRKFTSSMLGGATEVIKLQESSLEVFSPALVQGWRNLTDAGMIASLLGLVACSKVRERQARAGQASLGVVQ